MPITFYPNENLANFQYIQQAITPPNLLNSMNKGTLQTLLLTGRNPAAPTASLGDIWGYPSIAAGQQVRVLPAAGFTLALISDSAADTAAGTGARTVQVNYLDANYLPHTAIFTLNGQTAVASATSIDGGAGGAVTALRINGLEVITTGTGLTNAGNIYATDSSNTYAAGVPVTTTLVYNCILIGDNHDSTSMFTIPAGYYGLLLELIPSIADVTATQKFGKSALMMTTGANGIFIRFDFGSLTSTTNPQNVAPQALPFIQPKSDIRMQAQVSATTEVCCLNTLLLWPVV